MQQWLYILHEKLPCILLMMNPSPAIAQYMLSRYCKLYIKELVFSEYRPSTVSVQLNGMANIFHQHIEAT